MSTSMKHTRWCNSPPFIFTTHTVNAINKTTLMKCVKPNPKLLPPLLPFHRPFKPCIPFFALKQFSRWKIAHGIFMDLFQPLHKVFKPQFISTLEHYLFLLSAVFSFFSHAASIFIFIWCLSLCVICKKWIRSNHANTSQVLFQMFRKFEWMLEFYRSYNLHSYKFASRFASLRALVLFVSCFNTSTFSIDITTPFSPIFLKHVRTLGKCKALFCFCSYRFSVRHILILKCPTILSIWCVNCIQHSKILWSHESRFLFWRLRRYLVQMTQAFLSLLIVSDTITTAAYIPFGFLLCDLLYLMPFLRFSSCDLWKYLVGEKCVNVFACCSSKFWLRPASVIWHTATLHFARNKLGFVVDYFLFYRCSELKMKVAPITAAAVADA